MASTLDLSIVPSSPVQQDSPSEDRPDSSSSGRARPLSAKNDTGKRNLLYPQGDFRNISMPDLKGLKTDMMCNWLHHQQMERMWTTNSVEEGVMLKKAKDVYKCAPEDLSSRPDGVYAAVRRLNVKVKNPVKAAIVKLTVCLVRNDSQHWNREIVPAGRDLAVYAP